MKLLLGLGLLDLAFHYPVLTAFIFLAVFLYEHIEAHEVEDLKKIMSTIYSNGRKFSKYLTIKAKELGLTLKQLRRQVAIDLEVPETDYASIFKDKIDKAVTEDVAPPPIDPIEKDFVSRLTEEERKLYYESEVIHEKLYRVFKEAIAIEEVVWVKSSLRDCLMKDYDEDSDWNINYIKELEEKGIVLDWDAIFTEKDYRQLKMKLKGLSRNPDGTIKDQKLLDSTEMTLGIIHDYFTDYQFVQRY